MDGHRDQLTIANDSSCICSFDFLTSLAADDRREAASPSAAKRITDPNILNAEEVFIAELPMIDLASRKERTMNACRSTRLSYVEMSRCVVCNLAMRSAILAKKMFDVHRNSVRNGDVTD